MATVTRSVAWTFVGMIGVLLVYFIALAAVGKPELEAVVAPWDPFGVSAYEFVTKYWTASERNSLVPPIAGPLLFNRAFALILSALCLAAAYPLFSARVKAAGPGKATKEEPDAAATPAPDWSFVIPKALAVSLVLIATVLGSVVVAIGIQAGKGYFNFELDKYLLWYVLPLSWELMIMAALAVFMQALSPNKFVGWGLTLVYLIAFLALPRPGIEHPMLIYGRSIGEPLSDMNGQGR